MSGRIRGEKSEINWAYNRQYHEQSSNDHPDDLKVSYNPLISRSGGDSANVKRVKILTHQQIDNASEGKAHNLGKQLNLQNKAILEQLGKRSSEIESEHRHQKERQEIQKPAESCFGSRTKNEKKVRIHENSRTDDDIGLRKKNESSFVIDLQFKQNSNVKKLVGNKDVNKDKLNGTKEVPVIIPIPSYQLEKTKKKIDTISTDKSRGRTIYLPLESPKEEKNGSKVFSSRIDRKKRLWTHLNQEEKIPIIFEVGFDKKFPIAKYQRQEIFSSFRFFLAHSDDSTAQIAHDNIIIIENLAKHFFSEKAIFTVNGIKLQLPHLEKHLSNEERLGKFMRWIISAFDRYLCSKNEIKEQAELFITEPYSKEQRRKIRKELIDLLNVYKLSALPIEEGAIHPLKDRKMLMSLQKKILDINSWEQTMKNWLADNLETCLMTDESLISFDGEDWAKNMSMKIMSSYEMHWEEGIFEKLNKQVRCLRILQGCLFNSFAGMQQSNKVFPDMFHSEHIHPKFIKAIDEPTKYVIQIDESGSFSVIQMRLFYIAKTIILMKKGIQKKYEYHEGSVEIHWKVKGNINNEVFSGEATWENIQFSNNTKRSFIKESLAGMKLN